MISLLLRLLCRCRCRRPSSSMRRERQGKTEKKREMGEARHVEVSTNPTEEEMTGAGLL